MKNYILEVLNKQNDGFITPNQDDFINCDISELFKTIYNLIDDGILQKRDCCGLAYEYKN